MKKVQKNPLKRAKKTQKFRLADDKIPPPASSFDRFLLMEEEFCGISGKTLRLAGMQITPIRWLPEVCWKYPNKLDWRRPLR